MGVLRAMGVLGVMCALGLLLGAPLCVAAPLHLIAWAGNTPEWNRKLGVVEIRLGCSSEPARCMKSLDAAAKREGVDAITLSINSRAENVAAYALEYSAASLSDRRLKGIGIDDFVSALIKWRREQRDSRAPGRLVGEVVANTKKRNPDLQFGITLYEDQLQLPLLEDPFLPAGTRMAVDRVSLYLHFRKDAGRLPAYVRRVKQLFPRAEIFAGAYPYDRIDYLPCSEGRKRRCSPEEETRLFGTALRTQLAMAKQGEVAGIEFAPGNFGMEADWKGWNDTAACQPSRVRECVRLTREMHAMFLHELRDATVASGSIDRAELSR